MGHEYVEKAMHEFQIFNFYLKYFCVIIFILFEK